MGKATFQTEETAMKICKATVLIAGLCLFVSRVIAAPGLVPTPATQNTLNAHAGLRAMVQGERLTALYGGPDRHRL